MKNIFMIFSALFLCKSCLSQTVVFSDGFNGTSIDTTKWIVVDTGGASVTVSGGVCDMKNGIPFPVGSTIESKAKVYPPARISFRVKTTLDGCWCIYTPTAGFGEILFCEDNEVYWGGNYVDMQSFASIESTWQTDSIVWTSSVINWYVKDSLAYTVTTGIPVDCEPAVFVMYNDHLGNSPIYDFWIDTVYMEGAECPNSIEENTDKGRSYSLSVTNPVQNGIFGEINFSIPDNGCASLILYDLLGRQLKILVDKETGKGNHKMKLDNSLRSGIYFVTLQYLPNGKAGKTGKISKKLVVL